VENLIYYFSGTGNSLKAAKDILKGLGDGEIVSMTRPGKHIIAGQYETIGFIFPFYYLGLPKAAHEFIAKLDIGDNKDTYTYAVMTCGGAKSRNAISQLNELLFKDNKAKLAYGQRVVMFANNVLIYNMRKNIDWYREKYERVISKTINNIKNRYANKTGKSNALLNSINRNFINSVSEKDKNYTVNESCTGCGICAEVCPVKNISMVDNKPQYNNNCEQCVACIQYCPQKAINYKNKTQNRRRYTNPEISYKELSEYNNGGR
jgi:ferredoxin/flavodoxin